MDWKSFWNESDQLASGDFCRQVGRTFRGASYSVLQQQALVDRLLLLLQPRPGRTLLDLACGNGLITSRLAPHFAHVTAVDFSVALVATASRHFAAANIDYRVADVTDAALYRGTYDYALVSGAAQYLQPAQLETMLQALAGALSPGGRVVLGDVPDRDRLWNFYRGARGRWRYVRDAWAGTPIIGQWWRPLELQRAAARAGWCAEIHYQDANLPNHYFRFDAVLTRD